MKLKIAALCNVHKRMATDRVKGDADIVTCSIALVVRVQRDAADELAGMPIGATHALYDEMGAPYQHVIMEFPKRVIIASGWLEHRRDSGAAISRLELKRAGIEGLKFKLDIPDDQGPTVVCKQTLVWKAGGDEVDDVRAIIGHKCWMELTYEDPPQTSLFKSSAHSAKAEAEAGARAKLDRKRQAAGEKPGDNDAGDDVLLAQAIELVTKKGTKPSASGIQRALKIGYNRAERLIEAMEVLGLVTAMKADGGGRELIDQTGVGSSEIRPAPGNGETATAAAKSNVVDLHGKTGKRKASNLTELEREAADIAKKHPRRDPPKPRSPNDKRKH